MRCFNNTILYTISDLLARICRAGWRKTEIGVSTIDLWRALCYTERQRMLRKGRDRPWARAVLIFAATRSRRAVRSPIPVRMRSRRAAHNQPTNHRAVRHTASNRRAVPLPHHRAAAIRHHRIKPPRRRVCRSHRRAVTGRHLTAAHRRLPDAHHRAAASAGVGSRFGL